ncbi:hypothetical protein EV356DRAFT_520011 [Viridothelium virens]|uniref:Uncharacterized protein n=1 Tax=Viridothelium virens TaxID=1048519 RepID=A0A6A6GXC7_VIRVR|nr:hypothetical protein EV356DRAFT_520011 [Viridothelium virens]
MLRKTRAEDRSKARGSRGHWNTLRELQRDQVHKSAVQLTKRQLCKDLRLEAGMVVLVEEIVHQFEDRSRVVLKHFRQANTMDCSWLAYWNHAMNLASHFTKRNTKKVMRKETRRELETKGNFDDIHSSSEPYWSDWRHLSLSRAGCEIGKRPHHAGTPGLIDIWPKSSFVQGSCWACCLCDLALYLNDTVLTNPRLPLSALVMQLMREDHMT